MLKIMNEHYYVDIDELDRYLQIIPTETESSETKINMVKFEVVKTMLDVLLDYSENDGIDAILASNSLQIPFKLAFNTLLNKKIIKKY
jgi:hypothetical protein